MDDIFPAPDMSKKANPNAKMNRINRHKAPIPAYLLPSPSARTTQAPPSNQTNRAPNQKFIHRRTLNPNRAPWLEDDLKQLHRKLVKTPTSHHVIRDNIHKAPPLSLRPVPDNTPHYLSSQEEREMAEKQIWIDGMEIEEMEKQEWWAQAHLARFVRGFCVRGAGFMRVKGGYRCMEWEHLVTDELIKEGRGGCYLMARGSMREDPVWEGPFYGKEVVEQRYGAGATGPPPPHRGYRAGGRGLRQMGRRY